MQSRFRRSANVKAADWRLSKVLSQLKLLVTKHLLILAEEGDTRGGEAWHAQASKLAKNKFVNARCSFPQVWGWLWR